MGNCRYNVQYEMQCNLFSFSNLQLIILYCSFPCQYIRSERIKEELRNVDTLSEDRLDQLLQAFLNDFKEGKLDQNIWPTRNMMAYKVAKVALSAYTRILAKRYPKFCINCVDPGFVKTDLNWNLGVLPVEEGAEGPVLLALLPDGSPSGLFYDLKEVSSFE